MAATGKQHEAYKKAQGQRGQWCGHAGYCTCGSIKMQHLSRPRHHHPTTAKVTQEQITESATTVSIQSTMPCWTLLPVPDYTRTTPESVLDSSVDLSATDGTDSYHWEQMRTFHTFLSARAPPFSTRDTTVTGDSALQWTMLMPSLDTAWRRTYAWTEEREVQSVALSAPIPLPNISLALWNHRLGHNQHWTKGAKYWDHAHRYQK